MNFIVEKGKQNHLKTLLPYEMTLNYLDLNILSLFKISIIETYTGSKTGTQHFMHLRGPCRI